MPTREIFTFRVTPPPGRKQTKFNTRWKLTREEAAAKVANEEWGAAEAIESTRELRETTDHHWEYFNPIRRRGES